jgi:hypothetical protein
MMFSMSIMTGMTGILGLLLAAIVLVAGFLGWTLGNARQQVRALGTAITTAKTALGRERDEGARLRLERVQWEEYVRVRPLIFALASFLDREYNGEMEQARHRKPCPHVIEVAQDLLARQRVAERGA